MVFPTRLKSGQSGLWRLY